MTRRGALDTRSEDAGFEGKQAEQKMGMLCVSGNFISGANFLLRLRGSTYPPLRMLTSRKIVFSNYVGTSRSEPSSLCAFLVSDSFYSKHWTKKVANMLTLIGKYVCCGFTPLASHHLVPLGFGIRSFYQIFLSTDLFSGSGRAPPCLPRKKGFCLKGVLPLVAQSSTTGVTVAATPLCSTIRFRNPKVPRYPPPAPDPLPAANETGKWDGGFQRKVRRLVLGGGV